MMLQQLFSQCPADDSECDKKTKAVVDGVVLLIVQLMISMPDSTIYKAQNCLRAVDAQASDQIGTLKWCTHNKH